MTQATHSITPDQFFDTSGSRTFSHSRCLFDGVTIFGIHAITGVTQVKGDMVWLGEGTSIGGFAELLSEEAKPATATAVMKLKVVTGFTWDELAKVFGVSRRSVHAWACGSRLSHSHIQRLDRLTSVAQEYEKGKPELTRAAFHAPSSNGYSLFQQLVRTAHQGTPGPVFSPSRLLAPRLDIEAEPNPIIEIENID